MKQADNPKKNTRFKGIERHLPFAAFTCLLLSMALLLYQLNLNQAAHAALEALTEATPSIRWYEEETDIQTVSPIENQTESISVGTVSNTSSLQNGTVYVLNTSSKKIHSPACRYAQSMNSENKQIVENTSLEALISQGYTVCAVCGAQ